MTAKCVGCGLDWNVSIYQKIPRTGYICPHCESRLRAGETLPARAGSCWRMMMAAHSA